MVTVEHATRTVRFQFHHPAATDVQLVGDFTGWRTGQIRMESKGDGEWQAEVELMPGIYHFRYRADGQWFTDDWASRVQDGPFGADSVIWVLPTCTNGQEVHEADLPKTIDARLGMPAPQVAARMRELAASCVA